MASKVATSTDDARFVNAAERLRTLIESYFDFVWRSARRLGMSAAEADDATQDVFVVLARRLDSVEVGRERAFLFGTVVRVTRTRRRAQGRRPEEPWQEFDSLPTNGWSPERMHELSEARAELQRILESMSEEQRSVFVLYELEECSLTETADLLEIPLGTVSSRLKAARAAFAEAIERIEAKERFRSGEGW